MSQIETAFKTQLQWDISLALELRAVSPLLLRELEFGIPNYAGAKHQGFGQN